MNECWVRITKFGCLSFHLSKLEIVGRLFFLIPLSFWTTDTTPSLFKTIAMKTETMENNINKVSIDIYLQLKYNIWLEPTYL